MSNFSKIVIIILIVLSFFFIKEKYGKQIIGFINKTQMVKQIDLPKVDLNKEIDDVIKKGEQIKGTTNQAEKNTVSVYFLALDSNDNGIYKKVQRELPEGKDRLEFSIEELLKGPNIIEKTSGAYSEIPKETKLLSINQSKKKVIIDLSSDFQYGGGTDSIYSRMMQLIKTAINNSENKKIYLYIDGKQLNTLGGEGIMITQPLNEKSLEI